MYSLIKNYYSFYNLHFKILIFYINMQIKLPSQADAKCNGK